MKNKEHVPYRNCKLTHILKDSLTSKVIYFLKIGKDFNVY